MQGTVDSCGLKEEKQWGRSDACERTRTKASDVKDSKAKCEETFLVEGGGKSDGRRVAGLGFVL